MLKEKEENYQNGIQKSPPPEEIRFKVKKRNGFTLSEVLITLVIIGVVAAITVPSLVTAYQKRITEVRLKQAYSILVNAVKMSIADPNFQYTPPEVYNVELEQNDKYGIFKSYFLPYLQGVTEIPAGKYYKWQGKTPAGNSAYVANFARGGYCTNNGICYRIVNHGTNYFYIIVDLNGASGPNIVGKDIFYFALHFQDIGLKIDGYVYQVYKFTSNAQLIHRCGKNNAGWEGGSSCTELIMRNGWKIPDDYPIH